MISKLLDSCNSRDPTPPKQFERIKVGDVGFIRRGKFHRLFSAGSPGDDVPTAFEQLDVGTLDRGLSRGPHDCICTETVREVGVELSATASASLYVVSPDRPPLFSNRSNPGP